MTDYLKDIGSLLQNQINNLKRTIKIVSDELNIEEEIVKKCIGGKLCESDAKDLLFKFYEKYPISLKEIFIEKDLTDNGIIHYGSNKSKLSSRILNRPNKDNENKEFYEYRDTAMCKNSPFKPEYIKMLRHVYDADPYNKDVTYNKGHLLTQITFFIGPVNFYYILDGKKYCCEMNTGDSNFITPYIPHSFTKRMYSGQDDKDAIIIAVTFSSNVYNSLQDIIFSKVENISKISGNLRYPEQVLKLRIERLLELNYMNKENIISILENKYTKEQINQVLYNGIYHDNIINELCIILNIFKEELIINKLNEEVIIKKTKDSNTIKYEKNDKYYLVEQLAKSKHFPDVNGVNMTICGGGHILNSQFHQYVYNYGESSIEFLYGDKLDNKKIINKDDSLYIKPFTNYLFNKIEKDGNIIIIKLSGQINTNVLNEFASFEEKGKVRCQTEDSKWW